MTVLNFPASPTVGDTYTENNVIYTWNGTFWAANNAQSLDARFVNVAGDTMTGDLNLPNLVATGDVSGTKGTFTGDVSGTKGTFTGDVSSTGDIQSTSQNGGQLAGFRNQIINGSALFDQRNGVGNFTTASATKDVYGPDRWAVFYGAAFKMRALKSTGALALPGAGNVFQITSQNFNIAQLVELPVTGENAPFVQNSTWTLSFDARSESGSACNVDLYTSFGKGKRGNATTSRKEGTVSVVNGAWNRYSITFKITDAALADADNLKVQLTGGNGTATNLLFANVQLEPGPVATPFEHRPIGIELALCQRFYQARSSGTVNAADLRPTMRAAPTIASNKYDADF